MPPDPLPPAVLHVLRWSDPLVDARGFDPRSRYVETFWLPVLGPSATFLIRRLATELDAAPTGVDLDPDDVARSIGLGSASGPRAPFRRAVSRCIRFGAARELASGSLAVRRRVAAVPARHLDLLPEAVRELHRRWPAEGAGTPAAGDRIPDSAVRQPERTAAKAS